MSVRCEDPRVARIVALFETLMPADTGRLNEVYADDVRFKDPFNEVQGIAAVQRIFAHMFVALDEPHFFVRNVIVQGDACFLTWDFIFRFKRFGRALQTIRGGSHVELDAQGRITLHRDYWDAAEELYEKLPILGPVMRFLKRRAGR